MADLVLKDRDGTQITYNGVEVVSIPNAEGGTSHFLNLETGGIPNGGTDGQVLKKLSETDYDVGWEDEVDITGKADKVTSPTLDNFASLDANGNLKDSGKKASDFEIADTAIMKTDEAQIMTADLTLKGVPTTDNMAASKKYVDDGFEPKDITILKKANVVNDLVTGGIDVPLSAEQGKALSQDVEILKTDNTTNKTDITLLQKEIKDTAKIIAEANPNGEPKATVSGINSVSVPKVATQGGGKVTIDGALVKNETSYNPDTWAEWTKANVTIINNTCVIGNETINSTIRIPTIFKVNTKYGVLINIPTNTRPKYIQIVGGENQANPTSINIYSGTVGNYKTTFVSSATITVNEFYFWTPFHTVGKTELKDIRVYELPTGSQIETDFDTLTADELNAKYPFIQGTQAVTKTRVKSVGKNLFDLVNTSFINNNTTTVKIQHGVNVKSLTSGAWRHSYYLLSGLVSGQSYVFKANSVVVRSGLATINAKDKDDIGLASTIDGVLSNQYTCKFISPSDGIVRIKFYCTGATKELGDIDFLNIQIESGTVATPYEPHASNSVYLTPHPLYSLPSGVKDTIDTNGVLTKRVKKDTASGIVAVNTTNYPLAKNGGQFVNYLTAGGMETGIIGTDSTTGAGTLYYELALPVTTPNQATGTLILYPNGQVEIDNGMADGGLYTDSITILNTDYPIKTLEKIQKITDGYAVDIDVSTAVIALDGLSFTHPDLSNDVIVFEYTYDYEGVNGEAEVEYFDSRLVIADTQNGKFYKYKPVITEGVIASWAVEEV